MLYNFKNKKIIYRQELISVSDPDSLNSDPGILLNPDPEQNFITQVLKNLQRFFISETVTCFLKPYKGRQALQTWNLFLYSFFEWQFGLPGSGSADLIEYRSNPDPKHWGTLVHIFISCDMVPLRTFWRRCRTRQRTRCSRIGRRTGDPCSPACRPGSPWTVDWCPTLEFRN